MVDRWESPVQILIRDWLACCSGSIRQFPTSPGTLLVVPFIAKQYADTTFSPFTEYYVTTGTPVVGGIISNPTKFDITQKTPSSVYYGAGVGLPYTQYASTVPSKTNDLWIQGATNWTQYVVSPVGTWLQLIAYAPVEGPAGFYEMIQTDTTSSKYKTYQFNQGYNTMNFNADQVGRHMLYFVVNNQPSNVVIVDVFAQTPAGSTTAMCMQYLRVMHHEQNLRLMVGTLASSLTTINLA